MIVYLTGSPASGKSTLSQVLKKRLPGIVYFEYGKELSKLISKVQKRNISQKELRKKSGQIIRPEDIHRLDKQLIDLLKPISKRSTVIIDSHAITKEHYGFRAIPFSVNQLRRLNLSFIICLYAEGKVVRRRIKKNSEGRPLINEYEANLHTILQSAVAINYSTSLGIPIYFMKSDNLLLIAESISNIINRNKTLSDLSKKA